MKVLTVKFLAMSIFLGVLLCTSGGLGAGAHAQTPVEIRITPPGVQVAAGETVDLAVEVADVQRLYGFDVSLAFDPAVVEVVDADPGLDGIQVALGLLLDPGFVILNKADNEAGTVRFAMTQINPSEPKSGTGTLIVVKCRGKQAGTLTPITLVDAQLAQPDGTKPPTSLVSGELEVTEPAGQPTQTPMPTQGPGTPMPTLTPETPAATSTATPLATARPSASATATPVAPAPEPEVATATSLPPSSPPPGAADTPRPAAAGTQQVDDSPARSTPLPAAGTAVPPYATAPLVAAAQATVRATPSAMGETVLAHGQSPDMAGQPGNARDDAAVRRIQRLLAFGIGALVLTALVGAGTLAIFWRQRQRPGR